MVRSHATVGFSYRGRHYVCFSKRLQIVCTKISMYLVICDRRQMVQWSFLTLLPNGAGFKVVSYCYYSRNDFQISIVNMNFN